MTVYKVYLTGYFSNEIDVEYDDTEDYGFPDDSKIGELAVRIFEDAYSPVGRYTECWDSVQVDAVEVAE